MTSRNEMEELIIGVGSQGTASLAVIMKLLRALVSKGVLKQIEVVAILDSAAESAEKSPDAIEGKYSAATARSVRDMMDHFLDAPKTDKKH